MQTATWNGFDIIGDLVARKTWKYYVDTEFQLIDQTYNLQNWYASFGVGKQLTSRLLVFLTNRFLVGRQGTTGEVNNEYRLFQEADYELIVKPKYYLANRLMLEERKRFGEVPIAFRLRERLMLRIPLPFWPMHSFVISDEAFFNLNQPAWVSQNFYSQNRFFIGFGTIISKKFNFDIGYMNQYLIGTTNQMNNVIYFNINITGRTRYFKG